MISFFALVDLASVVPFYVSLAIGRSLKTSAFVRLFRIFRVLKIEGRFLDAFSIFETVFKDNARLLITSGFITGVSAHARTHARTHAHTHPLTPHSHSPPSQTVWIILSALFYVAEKDNELQWAYKTDGSKWFHRYSSIPMAAYYTMQNMLRFFPNVPYHNTWGKVLACITSVVAVSIVGLFSGILGSGFNVALEERRKLQAKARRDEKLKRALSKVSLLSKLAKGRVAAAPAKEELVAFPSADVPRDTPPSPRKSLNALLSAKTRAGVVLEWFIFILIIINVLIFMLGTVDTIDRLGVNNELTGAFWIIEVASVGIFTIEYLAHLYAAPENPKYAGRWGRLKYVFSFFSLVDLASILPFFVALALSRKQKHSTFIRCLRLIRMLKGEHYIHAFTTFDRVLYNSRQVLLITGFAVIVTWIFSSVVMYYTEVR
jgi:hypothetical protein